MPEDLSEPLPLSLLAAELARTLEANLFLRLQESGFPDLRPRHSAVLTSLAPEGTRLTTLAERANVTPQAMGELVDDLARKGYVERRPDPTDRRARLIVFTDLGTRALEECLDILAQIEAHAAQTIGLERYTSTRSALRDLLQSTHR